MSLSPVQLERLNELRKQWSVLEEELKTAEFVGSKPVIPAINALRYAGRQIVELLYLAQLPNPSPEQAAAIERAFTIADDYMHRAAADIVDALFFVIDGDVAIMRRKHSDTIIERHLPRFSELRTRLAACDTLIKQARKEVSTRTQNYKTMADDHYKPMMELYRQLREVEYSGIIPQREKEAEREQRGYGWTLYAGILAPVGVVATIFASIETDLVRYIVYRSYPLLFVGLAWFTFTCLIRKGYPAHAAQIGERYGRHVKLGMGALVLLGVINIYPETPALIRQAVAQAPGHVGRYRAGSANLHGTISGVSA